MSQDPNHLLAEVEKWQQRTRQAAISAMICATGLVLTLLVWAISAWWMP